MDTWTNGNQQFPVLQQWGNKNIKQSLVIKLTDKIKRNSSNLMTQMLYTRTYME
jgi:hypothetical protein